MKIILNENRFKSVLTKYLDNLGIDINIGWYGVGRYNKRIQSGFVTLKEDETIVTFQFSYMYEDNELSLYEIYPDIGRYGFGDVFEGFPNELLVNYFSEQIKDYIYKKLESNNIKFSIDESNIN